MLIGCQNLGAGGRGLRGWGVCERSFISKFSCFAARRFFALFWSNPTVVGGKTVSTPTPSTSATPPLPSPAPGLKCKVSWGILQIRTNQKIRRWRSLARVNRAKLSSEISEVSWVQFNHVESSSAVSRFLKEWTIHMAQCKVHSHCIGDENAYFVSLKSIPVPFVIHSSGKCEYHSQAELATFYNQ